MCKAGEDRTARWKVFAFLLMAIALLGAASYFHWIYPNASLTKASLGHVDLYFDQRDVGTNVAVEVQPSVGDSKGEQLLSNARVDISFDLNPETTPHSVGSLRWALLVTAPQPRVFAPMPVPPPPPRVTLATDQSGETSYICTGTVNTPISSTVRQSCRSIYLDDGASHAGYLAATHWQLDMPAIGERPDKATAFDPHHGLPFFLSSAAEVPPGIDPEEETDDGGAHSTAWISPLLRSPLTPGASNSISDPGKYDFDSQVPRGQTLRAYYVPGKLTTSETLRFVGPLLSASNYQVGQGAEVSGSDIAWTGISNPSFDGEKLDASERSAQGDLLAGVFLGFAAAAIIALVQEAPRDFPSRVAKRIPHLKERRR